MKAFKTIHIILLLCLQALLGSGVYAEGTLIFYHNDGFNNPIAATDIDGNVLWKERHAPFGEPQISETAKEAHPVDYTGHVYDKELGLHYMGARYYDPVLGRFMGNDPVGFYEDNPMSFNRYAYANNNPYKYVDPDGRSPVALVALGAWAAISFTGDTPGNRGISPTQQVVSEALAPLPPLLKGFKSADRANDVGKTGTKGASGTLTTASGKKYGGNSTGSSASGGDARAPMHPQTQQALDDVQKPSRTHGYCCEIDAINKALNAGDNIRGAKMGPVKLNESGRILPACSTCREVKKSLGVE